MPVVTEFMLFPLAHDGQCGGARITEFNAATKDAMTFLCSGNHRDNDYVETMGCHHAHDGDKEGVCERVFFWFSFFVRCVSCCCSGLILSSVVVLGNSFRSPFLRGFATI